MSLFALLCSCRTVQQIPVETRPRVGLTTQNEELLHALERWGAQPRLLAPEGHSPASLLDDLDALVLGPGADLDPALYGQPPHDTVMYLPADRQQQDLALLAEAMQRDMPLLGVCLGAQELAVGLGGALVQDIPAQVAGSLDHRAPHVVKWLPDTPLAGWFPSETVEVISRHHQSVDTLPSGLLPAASSPDGVLEAFYAPDRRFAVGVQYHPEADPTDTHDAMWSAFVGAAREYVRQDRGDWQASALPVPTCRAVHTPFRGPHRRELQPLLDRVSSGFGEYRKSYVKGHRHGGIDLRTSPGEEVFAICPGIVADIHLSFPHTTVVVEHHLADGSRIYSSYKHVVDLGVQVGDRVHEQTRVGRVFTSEEQQRAPWPENHLHLEIRTRIDDGGAASWTSMSTEALAVYASDPLTFFSSVLLLSTLPATR